jgi:hypothetical protein
MPGTGVAGIGAPATSVFGALFVCTSLNADIEATTWGIWLLTIVYAPLLFWGPLLGAVTVHYYRRRMAASPAPVRRPGCR